MATDRQTPCLYYVEKIQKERRNIQYTKYKKVRMYYESRSKIETTQ